MDVAESARELADPRTVGCRPRWSLCVVIALLVSGLVAFPLRVAVLRSDTGRIDGVWSQVSAMNNGRAALIEQLQALAVPGDESAVMGGERALAAEEISRLKRLDRSLPGLIPDTGLTRLRNRIRSAIRLEVADLQVTPTDPSRSTLATFLAVGDLLDAARRRFHAGGLPVNVDATRLHAADQALTALNRLADRPTGVRLAVTTSEGVHVVDLDAGRDDATGLTSDTQLIVAGRNVFAVVQGRLALLPADLRGPGRPLGPVTRVLPGRDGTVWVIAGGMVRHVDSSGITLSGPVRTEGLGNISGATDAGLVVQVLTGIRVIDPVTASAHAVAATPGVVLAAAGDTVAWAGQQTQEVHLTSVSTGRDRLVANAIQVIYPPDAGASLSPDGRTFVLVAGFDRQTPGSRLLAVDVASGTPMTVLGTVFGAFDPGNLGRVMAWSADSRELFFTYPAVHSVDLWRVGEPAANHLRYRPPGVGGLAVLP